MNKPTFTQEELATAFGLLLSKTAAEHWARDWFERFVDDDDIDGAGRYLYRDWDEEESAPPNAITHRGSGSSDPTRTGYEHFSEKSEDEIGEFLMSFSDFHLTLTSLVSAAVGERVRIARNDTPEAHARRQEQMKRIIASMRPTR